MSIPKQSPVIKLRSRDVDTRLNSPRDPFASSVPSTSKYLFTSDGKRFHNNDEGSLSAEKHERLLAVCKKRGITTPPPSQKNLFGSRAEHRDEPPEVPSPSELQQSLLDMTEELERSRALMDQRYQELQAREDILQITIQEGI